MVDPFAVELDGALGQLHRAREGVHDRGLAGPVRTEQREGLAVGHVERDGDLEIFSPSDEVRMQAHGGILAGISGLG